MDLHLIQFCAEECERQQSGELSVFHMCRAYEIARLFAKQSAMWRPSMHELVLQWGMRVEPRKNANGFRTVPVFINHEVIRPDNIRNQMKELCLAMLDGRLNPLEAYTEFEKIHPFIDGNSRVGSILYNYLGNTLDHPTIPPDVLKKELQEDWATDTQI